MQGTKGGGKKVALVVAQWNGEITSALVAGAESTLLEAGVYARDILKLNVPASFELPFGAKEVLQKKSVE